MKNKFTIKDFKEWILSDNIKDIKELCDSTKVLYFYTYDNSEIYSVVFNTLENPTHVTLLRIFDGKADIHIVKCTSRIINIINRSIGKRRRDPSANINYIRL